MTCCWDKDATSQDCVHDNSKFLCVYVHKAFLSIDENHINNVNFSQVCCCLKHCPQLWGDCMVLYSFFCIYLFCRHVDMCGCTYHGAHAEVK